MSDQNSVEQLAGAWQKHQAATRHIDTFEDRLNKWLRDKAYHLVRDPNTSALQRAMLLRAEPIDADLCCLAGDAVHNLRSALDHLAYSVACVKNVATELLGRVAFTARENSNAFTKEIAKEKVTVLGEDWLRFISDMQPYLNGNGSELYTVCRLDNIDKHRNLLLMATVGDKYRLDITGTEMSMTVLERGLPLREGVRLADYEPHIYTQVRVSLNESDCGLDPDSWVHEALRSLAVNVKKVLVSAELQVHALFTRPSNT